MLLDIIWGNDGTTYVVTENLDSETLFIGFVIALTWFIITHFTLKELWDKIKSYFKGE